MALSSPPVQPLTVGTDLPERSPLGWRRHLGVLLFYGLLTALMTYPLVTAPHRLILGPTEDALVWPWNFSWIRQALAVEHRFPFAFDHALRPFTLATFHHTHTFLYGLLYCALAVLYENPVFWLNAFIFASFILAGYGTFLLSRMLTGDTRGALLAGVIFAFCSYRLVRMTCHFNLLIQEWIPFYLYFIIRWAERNRARDGVAAALCLAASAWTDYYAALFLLFFSLVFLRLIPMLGLLRGWPARARLRSLVPGVAAGALLLGPLLFVLSHTLGRLPVMTYNNANGFPAVPLAYLIPSRRHVLLGGLVDPIYFHDLPGNEIEATVFFGITAMLLALWGLIRIRRKPRYFIYFTVCLALFLLLSFGNSLRLELGGRSLDVPMPYRLLTMLPYCADFRAPARFGSMVALCAAVLAGYSFATLGARIRSVKTKNIAAALLMAAVLFENLQAPVARRFDAFDPVTVPMGLLREVARDPHPGAVLKFPFSHWDYGSIWLQTFHHKPAVTGLHSRMQDGQAAYYDRLQLDLMGWFRPDPAIQMVYQDPLVPWTARDPNSAAGRAAWPAEPGPWTPEKAAQFCRFFNLRQIIIPWWHLAVRLRLELLPVEKTRREGLGLLVTLKPQPETYPLRIEGGSPADNCHFLSGFLAPEGGCRWMSATKAEVAFRLERPLGLRLRARLGYPSHFGPGEQKLTLRVNGHAYAERPVRADWAEECWDLPPAHLKEGYNVLEFQARDARPAGEVAAQPLALRLGWLQLERKPFQ